MTAMPINLHGIRRLQHELKELEPLDNANTDQLTTRINELTEVLNRLLTALDEEEDEV